MDEIAKSEKLTETQLNEETKAGTNIFRSRVHWAQVFLVQAGAITRPQRGFLEITARGVRLLEENPKGFDRFKFREFPDYANAWGRGEVEEESLGGNLRDFENSTPQERIEAAINEIDTALAGEIVQRVRNLSPKFLELVILKLLNAMGYGSSLSNFEHVGGPGDGGIDGIINEDSLGLQRIYVQAKRYKEDSTVGRPEIQKFVGALSPLGASGGVFITTSAFSSDAREYAKLKHSAPIALIDGSEFGKLMVRYGIGVQKRQTFSVAEIDEDYFEE